MINIAMLSEWHVHAKGTAQKLLAMKDVNITCVWDENVERGTKWAKEINADFVADLDECLSREDVDGVVCYTETTSHKEVLIKAAKHGKHIFTEKALAPTVSECKEIADVVRESGVKFAISLHHRKSPLMVYAKQLVDSGKLGDISYARVRVSHDGASSAWLPDYWFDLKGTAGGAMMDLGCHPMYMLNHLFGRPKSISSLFTTRTKTPIDDAAISIIEFQNGVSAVAESGFVTYKAPFAIEIYGTEGSFIVRDGIPMLCLKSLKEVTEKFIEVTKISKDWPQPIELFVDAIRNDTIPEHGLDDAIALTELLENAYKAHEQNTMIKIGE